MLKPMCKEIFTIFMLKHLIYQDLCLRSKQSDKRLHCTLSEYLRVYDFELPKSKTVQTGLDQSGLMRRMI